MKTITELINLKNRGAIVTGGAGYLGKAICETLMELGAKVIIFDKDKDVCQHAVEQLEELNHPGTIDYVVTDLANTTDLKQAAKESISRLGNLDIIVHSAAFVGTTNFPGWAVPFEEQTEEAWDAAMDVNLKSIFTFIKQCKSYLEKTENASIIFIGSIYGMVGPDFGLYEGTEMTTPAAYAASKGGLLQLSKYFTTLLAPKIRVNTITAGGIVRGQSQSFQQKYNAKTPLARMATEEDFKGAIAYLASDLSRYVTGTNMIIDGGFTAW
jgi:NAD(P)-dependent dehydrogenase (short-subunit alcohol dehydrogenase family)